MNVVSTASLQDYKQSIYSTVPISSFYSGKAAQTIAGAWGTSELPIATLVLPYPLWTWLGAALTFDGTSSYHAFDLRLQKRYSQGLEWNIAYTVSKTIISPLTWSSLAGSTIDPMHNFRPGVDGGLFGAVGAAQLLNPPWQDNNNVKSDRALAPYDVPQMLTIASTYELPFGKGRKFISRGSLPNAILGGWRLGGMFTAQSGVPLMITGPCNGIESFNNSNYGNPCLPNLVGRPTSFGTKRTRAQQIAQWFNPNAFQPVFGTDPNFWTNPDVNSAQWWEFGTAGARLPGARAPGFWNLDASLNKDFHVNEEDYVEFRWEVFNALNHQNLGIPNTSYCLPPGPNGETNLVQQAGCSFGLITNIQTDPRAMQFGLRFVW